MSANDDDVGGDEDQLKQLRSVWVSMRESDEDPPDRGLDALMAAARTKAADMTPAPSEGFWTKVLAAFRRPPVLAFASIAVLLGGALFIAGRHDTMQREESAPERSALQAPAAPQHGYEPAPAAATGSASATPPQEIAAPPPPEVTRSPEVTRAPATTRPRARPPAVVTEKPAEPKLEAKKSDEGGAAVASPGAIDTATVGGLKQVESDVTAAPQSGTRGPVAKTPAAESSQERADPKLSMDNDEAAASTTDRRAKDTQVTQLVKQCESAAARNDCAAVRVLAKRIKSADAEAYTQRVAKNAAIARCLE